MLRNGSSYASNSPGWVIKFNSAGNVIASFYAVGGFPSAMTLGSDNNLYIMSYFTATTNHRDMGWMYKYDLNGNPVKSFASGTSNTIGAGSLPVAIATAPTPPGSGNLHISQ